MSLAFRGRAACGGRTLQSLLSLIDQAHAPFALHQRRAISVPLVSPRSRRAQGALARQRARLLSHPSATRLGRAPMHKPPGRRPLRPSLLKMALRPMLIRTRPRHGGFSSEPFGSRRRATTRANRSMRGRPRAGVRQIRRRGRLHARLPRRSSPWKAGRLSALAALCRARCWTCSTSIRT
jgi:hypothetical protein